MPGSSPEAQVAPPTAPPTTPGPIRRQEPKPVWPGVLGVILLITGALALVVNGVSILSQVFYSDALRGVGAAPPAQWWTSTVVLLTLGLLLNVAQIVAGALLLKRSRAAVPWSLTWAAAKIVLALINVPIAWLVQQDQLGAMTGANPVPGTFASMMAAFGVMVGAAMSLWLPVLLFAWLLRPSIRRQTRAWPTGDD